LLVLFFHLHLLCLHPNFPAHPQSCFVHPDYFTHPPYYFTHPPYYFAHPHEFLPLLLCYKIIGYLCNVILKIILLETIRELLLHWLFMQCYFENHYVILKIILL
jgi:hypothetical protein